MGLTRATDAHPADRIRDHDGTADRAAASGAACVPFLDQQTANVPGLGNSCKMAARLLGRKAIRTTQARDEGNGDRYMRPDRKTEGGAPQ